MIFVLGFLFERVFLCVLQNELKLRKLRSISINVNKWIFFLHLT